MATTTGMQQQQQQPFNVKVMRVFKVLPWKNTSLLSLPNVFGSIYVGQMFRCIISVRNCVDIPMKQVSIVTELDGPSSDHVKSSQESLLRKETTLDEFKLNDYIDFMAEFPLLEPGGHTLMVSIAYDRSGTRLTFFKKYQFAVLEPLSISVSVAPALTSNAETRAQVIIKSLMKEEDGDLLCVAGYSTANNSELVLECKLHGTYLSPGDVQSMIIDRVQPGLTTLAVQWVVGGEKGSTSIVCGSKVITTMSV